MYKCARNNGRNGVARTGPTICVCMVATVTHNGRVVALLIWLDVMCNSGPVASQESM